MKHEIRISKAITIILFLALIRTIAEPFRLQNAAPAALSLGQIQPYLLAGFICAVGLLVITVLNYYERHRWIIAMGVLIIAALVWIKVTYL